MGNHNGNKLGYKQEASEDIRSRAKKESQFSDRLYDILIHYQERFFDPKYKVFHESEKVGDLNLPLSRLYNDLWSEFMEFGYKGKKRGKQEPKQKEVIA